jgi:hypothetical protein
MKTHVFIHVQGWVGALLSQTATSIWWILSALSTLSTFFIPKLSGQWRAAFALSTGLGFAWANLRVYQRQQHELSATQQALLLAESHRSQLRITPNNGSRYILQPVNDSRHADFSGGFFEFHLMVENSGPRNSTIDRFQVDILELRRTFGNLPSIEGQNGARGRHSNQGLYAPSILSRNGIVQVNSESATGHGTLLFFIPEINLQNFVDAGLRMNGEQRMFGNLHCRLTLTDTTQSSTTHEFELHEQ